MSIIITRISNIHDNLRPLIFSHCSNQFAGEKKCRTTFVELEVFFALDILCAALIIFVVYLTLEPSVCVDSYGSLPVFIFIRSLKYLQHYPIRKLHTNCFDSTTAKQMWLNSNMSYSLYGWNRSNGNSYVRTYVCKQLLSA